MSLLPAKRDLAEVGVVAHARVQLEQLPHALAVHAPAGDFRPASREMADQGLEPLARGKATGNLAPFESLVARPDCPAPVLADVEQSLHCLVQLDVHLLLFDFLRPLLPPLRHG